MRSVAEQYSEATSTTSLTPCATSSARRRRKARMMTSERSLSVCTRPRRSLARDLDDLAVLDRPERDERAAAGEHVDLAGELAGPEDRDGLRRVLRAPLDAERSRDRPDKPRPVRRRPRRAPRPPRPCAACRGASCARSDPSSAPERCPRGAPSPAAARERTERASAAACSSARFSLLFPRPPCWGEGRGEGRCHPERARDPELGRLRAVARRSSRPLSR